MLPIFMPHASTCWTFIAFIDAAMMAKGKESACYKFRTLY